MRRLAQVFQNGACPKLVEITFDDDKRGLGAKLLQDATVQRRRKIRVTTG